MRKIWFNLKKIIRGDAPLVDIWHYLVGKYRITLYYSKHFKWLLRKHIVEQYEFRLESMKPECYMNGECVKCGCETTALQMASKPCKGNCYPIMMNKQCWELVKNHLNQYFKKQNIHYVGNS